MAAEQDEGGQRPAPAPSSGGSTGGGGNFFTRKVAGVPVWVGMLAALGLLLAFLQFRKNKAASASAASTTANTAATAAAESSQMPPFIIQNYTSQSGGGSRPPATHPATPTTTPPTPLPTYTVTGKGDTNVSGLIATLYKTPPADTTEYAILAQQILDANPVRPTWGSSIPVGTVINLPAGYVPGKIVK